jgi:hypothetical protein
MKLGSSGNLNSKNVPFYQSVRIVFRKLEKAAPNNPGSRTLKVAKTKSLSDDIALADCCSSIISPKGSLRIMESSFI